VSSLRAAIRARFTPGRITLAVLLIGLVFVLAALFEGGDSGPPKDSAAALVPADVLVYVHATVDTGSEQWRNATELVRRLPQLQRLRDRVLRGLTAGGARLDLERQVYPWLGDEAAIALVADKRGAARSLILLEASDPALARDFLARAIGHRRETRYRGVRIEIYGKLATAFVSGFLAIGRPANVRASIDAWGGRIAALASRPTFRRVRAGLPDRDRLLYAYASRAGLRGVLAVQPGLTGRVSKLVDDPSLEAAAAAAQPEKSGLRVDFASVLRRADRAANERRFTPQLLDVVPQEAIAYIGARGADRVFDPISRLAGDRSLRLPPVLRRLRDDLVAGGSTRIRRALQPLLRKETALFVSPGGTPLVSLVIDDVPRGEAVTLLERFQPVLARLVKQPVAGQVPTFQPRRIGTLDAATLRLSPSLELTFAAFGGRAVLTTNAQVIRALALHGPTIRENPLLDERVEDSLEGASSVVFLDLEQLLAIGEQAGLGETSSFRAFKDDYSKVEALSAVTHDKSRSRTAAIFIEVQ
jgi:hypothetical protein